MTIRVHEFEHLDLPQAFAAVQDLPYSLLLDSADTAHPNARYSFAMWHPVEMIEAKDGYVTITNADQQTRLRQDPFQCVKERVRAWGAGYEADASLPPFQGGAAGFFGYDLARGIESLPAKSETDPDMPDMAIGIYMQVLACDHRTGRAWLISRGRNEQEALIREHAALKMLERPVESKRSRTAGISWKAADTPDQYKEKVAQVIDYIRAGDIFQANLSQRFDAALPAGFDSYGHYLHLRRVNPAPFAAYMNLGGVHISSASPERFLKLRERLVETRPIKGTRPRGTTPEEDKKLRGELMASAKDRAENTMIVDLLRNDLSKVCLPESIQVTELCALESFSAVHHLVSTIGGTLRPGAEATDLLRACFPGGSITGAPKIRAMEIIEEMEPARRGPYCGAMAYIGFDGAMDSSILIRTLVYGKNTVSLQAGGGITADSNPDEEYQETLDKARRILDSFNMEQEKQREFA